MQNRHVRIFSVVNPVFFFSNLPHYHTVTENKSGRISDMFIKIKKNMGIQKRILSFAFERRPQPVHI